MQFVKRYLPFVLITTCFLYLLYVALKSIFLLFDMYSFAPYERFVKYDISPDFSFGEVGSALWHKILTVNPVNIEIPGVVGELVAFAANTLYGGLIIFLALGTWILSTRVKLQFGNYSKPYNVFWSGKLARWVMLVVVLGSVLLSYLAWVTFPIYEYVIPSFNEQISTFEKSAERESIPAIGVQNIHIWNLIFMLLPIIPVLGVVLFIIHKWKENPETTDIFYDWEYRSGWLGSFFSHQQSTQYPDIIIGRDVKNNEVVIQFGQDRNLNNLIVGSIGSGKTAAMVIPMINQDMNYMVDFINRFNDETDEDRVHRVNGMIVIEPSNDLCRKAYQLAISHGIPEEAIYYLDPTNPNTISINPLRGPVEKAVETFTMVIQGIAGDQDEFFKQSQRSHLKHYVYLLKLTRGNDATFDMLMELYHDARKVADMLIELERNIPENWEEIEDRDERNHWHIVYGITRWFRERGLEFLTDNNGFPVTYPKGHIHQGKQMVVDKQMQFVEGLRNILDDISASKLIRRVLFGNSDFDIDVHLKTGGVLLCNTEKGQLSQLSNVLGQFLLLLSANGIFRRDSNQKDPYHSLYVDEFPDYIYEGFKEIPAQSRKYKTIITTASQSLAQLSQDFGDNYMYTLVSTFRHKMVYADVDPKTAEVFSSYFGEDEVYSSSFTQQTVPSMMQNPGRRDGSTVQKVQQSRLSVSDIIHLKEFEAAVKLVENNRSKPVRVVKANFVPESEFVKARKRVKESKKKAWLDYRRKLMDEMNDQLLSDLGILEEGKYNPKDAYPKEAIQDLMSAVADEQKKLYLSDQDRKARMVLQETEKETAASKPGDITCEENDSNNSKENHSKNRKEKNEVSSMDFFDRLDGLEPIQEENDSSGKHNKPSENENDGSTKNREPSADDADDLILIDEENMSAEKLKEKVVVEAGEKEKVETESYTESEIVQKLNDEDNSK